MRVRTRSLTAGIVTAGLAATALAPSAATAQTASAPTPTTTQPAAPPPTAVVPDTSPAGAAPAPATTPAVIDPAAPLELSDPAQPHAVEDPAETAKPARDRLPKTSTTPGKPATNEPSKPAADSAAPAAPASPADGAALAAIPSVPRSGVPTWFIDSFRIPMFLLPIFQAAGTEYGIRWEVLAAINEIETDYGRNLNVSSAGATGWMQFMPATWVSYGVDANRDGRADPYNAVDAIFAAARYLEAAGAQTDLSQAIFAYNHADWYVRSVLERAQRLAALPADLVAALTGLASGRSPVLGQARAMKPLSTPVRSVRLSVRDSARVVAVADARVVRIGYSTRLGRYIRVRDAFGNTYTYGRLSKLARRFPVLRPAPVEAAAATIGRDPAPTMPATAGVQPAPAATAGVQPAPAATAGVQPAPAATATGASQLGARGASSEVGSRTMARPGVAPAEADSLAEAVPPVPLVVAPAIARIAEAFARQTPADSTAARGSQQRAGIAAAAQPAAVRLGGPLAALDWAARARRFGIGLPAAAPRPRPADPARPTAYDRRLLGDIAASRVAYRPLREGSRVVAGTILGRAERPSGRSARLRFEIRPAGRRSVRIDPAPIVAGWKLLQASSAGAASLGAAGQPSIGQVMLLGKHALQRLVLANPRITIYPCGRDDIRAGRIDRRVLATLQLLAMSGLSPTVSSLTCGHSRLTSSGNVSEHWSGGAVDISAINGTPILGHQGAGSIADTTIRRLLTLQGTMQPHQIISLMTYASATNTLALADHADHIHVGFTPQQAPGSLAARLFDGVLEPKAWQRLVDRLAAIDNPRVATSPSAASIVATPKRP
jgi:hypothetical protein